MTEMLIFEKIVLYFYSLIRAHKHNLNNYKYMY